MLRDPKDVALEIGAALFSSERHDGAEAAIRARDREVIAEAMDVVRAFATVEQPTDKILAALDAILEEE